MLDFIRWMSKEYLVPAIVGIVVILSLCILLVITHGTSDGSTANITDCITSSDCTSDRTCLNRKCEDACRMCGAHTACHVSNHVPYCSCVYGFEGNPLTGCSPGPNVHAALLECTKHDQCSHDSSCIDQRCQDPCTGVCGVNAVCHVKNHHPACACSPGYAGDPFTRCEKQKPQCVSNDQCNKDQACILDECKDPCLEACGVNTICLVKNHHASCYCSEGHSGDPLHGCEPRREPLPSAAALVDDENTQDISESRKPVTAIHGRSHISRPVPDDSKLYHVFTDMKLSWSKAMSECESIDMKLASFNSPLGYEKIVEAIQYRAPYHDIDNFWIAANNLEDPGKYVWATTGEYLMYTRWGPNEPSGKGEHCVELRGEQGYKMNDQECSDEIYYICEADSNIYMSIFK